MILLKRCCQTDKIYLANQLKYRFSQSLDEKYDAIIIGGGHNGLVASYYLQKANIKTLVLERRHIVGGAAVSEEIIEGYKFSRASYLYSLFRPYIVEDMKLKQRGLKFYTRDPSSFTISPDNKQYLLMGNSKLNTEQISKFSKKDAEVYPIYEDYLARIVQFFDPMFDENPLHFDENVSIMEKLKNIQHYNAIYKRLKKLKLQNIPEMIELLTAPASKILNRWFESEPLKGYLATDAIIGALHGPSDPGSAYVLLHHVMGTVEGKQGSWAYCEGGMGGISQLLSQAAQEAGVTIKTESTVKQILLSDDGKSVKGVLLENGKKYTSNTILSNTTSHVTYKKLIPEGILPAEFMKKENSIDYRSPVIKINLALKSLPNFSVIGKKYEKGQAGPEHQTTLHLGCSSIEDLDNAYKEYLYHNRPSSKPMIEMTIPSVLDKTLVKNKDHHVAGLFVQYAPNNLPWGDKDYKQKYVDHIFNIIEQAAPGFKDSIVGYEALSTLDLENIFNLTGGNIFHGALSLDQLYFNRPNYKSPIKGLYICGSSAHPGGGVTGAPGANCAKIVINDNKNK